MESISNPVSFTKEGWVDYRREKLAPPSSYEPFWWENFDWQTWGEVGNRNKHYPVIISGVYIAIIFGLRAFMRNRKPFVLKRELVVWNGALGLFSILGVIRVLPDLWGKINRPNGLHYALCVKDDISIPMSFWAAAFVISKIVELGDTVFIVLRKKPLKFLQWFHHSVTLISTWNTGPYLEPIARFYIVINYGVHSLMYPYFSLMALGVRIPRKAANVVTFLQLVQMLVGVTINLYTSYLYYFHASCYRHPFSIIMMWIVYGSFVVLFGDLFYRLVIKKKSDKCVKVE
ncbi:elongation of very long chain fatty acids protein 6 [Folsomia candida]|uniref:Elongation of very long chain fatty acids protein n=1 Tax=Folsomia candida TaxID=158441 RepID=A0A226DZ79_FOLCA|nr:elongation of very long chain fatty acids protein 6 [Folsomia candida]OXA50001.1 Elongation of very long chain fatty acids protein 6 [Folsomia candida]